MGKSRKTKKEKLQSKERRQKAEGFVIKDEWLTGSTPKAKTVKTPSDLKYFRTDLTKTLFLTMLVLAVELAIWQYLSRH